MEDFAFKFTGFLQENIIFPGFKTVRCIIRKGMKNEHCFTIHMLEEKGYSRYQSVKQNDRRRRFTVLEFDSFLIFEMNFEQKEIVNVRKDRFGLKNEILNLFQNFLEELPESSKEMKMYQGNQKKHRLKWLFES